MDMKPYEGNGEISSYVRQLFEAFKDSKRPWEDLFEELWYNYIGQYNQSTTWRTKEGQDNRSRIFIRMTQLKVSIAHAKLKQAIGEDTPFGLEPYGESYLQMQERQLIKDIINQRVKSIKDYIEFIKLSNTLDTAMLDMCIFGTGIIKGPVLRVDRNPVMVKNMIMGLPAEVIDPALPRMRMEYQDETNFEFVPVPIWEYYTDFNAKTTKDAIGEIHYQRMLPSQLEAFLNVPGYKKEAILSAISKAASVEDTDTDKTYIMLGDRYTGVEGEKDKKVPVIEYQGKIPAGMLRNYGHDIPKEVSDEQHIEAIVILAGDGECLKAEPNYMDQRTFYVCPYKKRPHCIPGIGPAEAMMDSQKMVNSSARMMIDNKALSGNGMVALNHTMIDWNKTKDASMYPRKVWFIKNGNRVEDAVKSLTIQDVTLGLRELLELFLRFADEETGIPKFEQGSSGSFLNKTATGMSMLLGQLNINLKPSVKNMDEYWISPIIEATDKMLSLLKYPEGLKMPLKVIAKGTLSLISKEITQENLIKLLSVTQAPQDNMLVDRAKIIRQIAVNDGVEDFTRTPEEVSMIQEQSKKENVSVNRASVDIDKLYPFLTRKEQEQVLIKVGIVPDTTGGAPIQNPMQVPPVEDTQGVTSMVKGAGQNAPAQY